MANSKKTLTADNWATAALEAIAEGGVEMVAVEPLARRLGVTKGSFYWHFPNREALLYAAVAIWEAQETEGMLARIGEEMDPRRRIQRVFSKVDASQRASQLYFALAAAAAKDPHIGEIVGRVSRRRVEYLDECYVALGMDKAEAHRWATTAYSVYLGILQVRRDVPDALPEEPQSREYQEYMAHMFATLIPELHPSVKSQVA